jgi:uncharacterized protein YehS (DUF1456 family)
MEPMNNNDTLRRLRYALHLNDEQMAALFTLSGRNTSSQETAAWLAREEDAEFRPLSDSLLCQFLDGLIIEKRGPHPSGALPQPLKKLPNNEILKKLRIALELRDDQILELFNRAEFTVTKAELGAFFRRPDHRNYRDCPDQVLKKFIKGLSTKS